MNELCNTIYRYYQSNFAELPADKQFHFASRLYLWKRDETSLQRLKALRPWFTHNENPKEALEQIIASAAESPIHGSKNASEQRRPYFEKYPQLKASVSVLFRIIFLQNIYGIDGRHLFYSLFDEKEIEKMASDLLADKTALSILSTHAINFLYLYEGVIKGDTNSLNPHDFLALGQTQYDLEDPIHLQLLIYLYTHCIIGESLFYYRALPKARMDIYRVMISRLEQLIDKYFDQINLDNKFEFLVCTQLVHGKSYLKERIFEEAGKSLSEYEDFLIDRHNSNPQTDNISLDKSEHRNVLFIMANHDYKPIG